MTSGDVVPSERGKYKDAKTPSNVNTCVIECYLLHVFREKIILILLWQTPLVAQVTAIPASDLCRWSQRRLTKSNGAIPLVKANWSNLVPPLSAIGLVLANDIGRKWARGEKGLRIEVFSTILLPSAWEDVMPSALQPGVHEERIVQQTTKGA